MRRRTFLRGAAGVGLAYGLRDLPAQTADRYAHTAEAALAVLAGNIHTVPSFIGPVLFEGSTYQGIWQECGPHEALTYARLRALVESHSPGIDPLRVARDSHRVFFALQREDGQMPASVKPGGGGFAQIQMVVPIAATAWDLAQMAQEETFLAEAYSACSRWDAWLRRYRDTRGTGLVEAFCTYDTGQDNSPRWAGIPNRCEDGDARKCPPAPGSPRLCPDLSATVFGARVALSAMAEALGKKAEAQRWKDDAEHIRSLIVDKLWSPEDASFFDLDTSGHFVRVRSVANTRVLGEHVLRLEVPKERSMFEQMWTRQLHNTKAFWAAFPFPSVAMDDPKFVRPIPRNSWGGASQALTALRTLRWMDHYGKGAEQRVVMQRWCEAIIREGEFRQQMDPHTGVFTQPDPRGYSPCALVFLAFAQRLGKLRADSV